MSLKKFGIIGFIPYEDVFINTGIGGRTLNSPSGANTANVRIWGGGGAGGVRAGPNATEIPGGGGGGSGFALKNINFAGTISVTGISGSGGLGGSGTTGNSGGSSAFNYTGAPAIISVGGGLGGQAGLGGTGGTTSNGDTGSSVGQDGAATGVSEGGNTGGLIYVTSPSSGNTAGIGGRALWRAGSPGAGGYGGFISGTNSTARDSESGRDGEIRILWATVGGNTTPSFRNYHVPISLIQSTGGSYVSPGVCSATSIYLSSNPRIWSSNTYQNVSLSSFETFETYTNTTGTTCVMDSTGFFIVRFTVTDNDTEDNPFSGGTTTDTNRQVSSNHFTSLTVPNGTTFNSADATFSYDGTYNIWEWSIPLPQTVLTTGTNQFIVFKK
jgi:hypothetical protein